MYKTRLNPPPANGWVPPADLLVLDEEIVQPVSLIAVSPLMEEEFALVAPEPPQPRLDFSSDAQRTGVKRLLINGDAAVFIHKRKEGGKLLVTARMESTGLEKTFTVPPAKVKIL